MQGFNFLHEACAGAFQNAFIDFFNRISVIGSVADDFDVLLVVCECSRCITAVLPIQVDHQTRTIHGFRFHKAGMCVEDVRIFEMSAIVQYLGQQLQDFKNISSLYDKQSELAVTQNDVRIDRLKAAHGVCQSYKEHRSHTVIYPALVFYAHMHRFELRDFFGTLHQIGKVAENGFQFGRDVVGQICQIAACCDVNEISIIRLTNIHRYGITRRDDAGCIQHI